MSLTCQFEQLSCSYTLDELSREAVLESQLKIPETVPKINAVISGNFQVGAPVIEVNNNSCVISGIIYPQLLYTTTETSPEYDAWPGEYRHQPEYNENDAAGTDYTPREPNGHSFIWSGENGLVYEERFEIPGLPTDNPVTVKITPRECTFEKSGPDRVSFSARLIISIQPAIQRQTAIIADIIAQPAEMAMVVKEPVMTEQFSSVKRSVLPVQTTLLLPGLKPGIARILHCAALPGDLSCEYSRGKIYLKGFLDINLVYAGRDDDDLPTEIMVNEWNRESGNAVPFETYFETDVPGEDLLVIPSVIPLDTSAAVKSRREITCQVNLDCRVDISRVYSREIVTGVTPAPGTIIDIQKKEFNFEEYLGEAEGEIAFELAADLPAGQPGAERLLAYEGRFSEPKIDITEGSAAIECNLDLWLLYMTDGPTGPELLAARWGPRDNLQVAGMVEFPNLQPGSFLRNQITLESIKLDLINERSVKVSGRIKARLWARNPRVLTILEDCAEVIPVNPETRPSMLFYIVQPGDTLWKIARRYQTTMAQLLRFNQISNPARLDTGQKLLIPKLVQ